jgi:hypothetical protein
VDRLRPGEKSEAACYRYCEDKAFLVESRIQALNLSPNGEVFVAERKNTAAMPKFLRQRLTSQTQSPLLGVEPPASL